MVGQSVLHYDILEKLGEGGMGVVYKARDTRLGRLVAIKLLPPEATPNSEQKQRFEKEAKITSSLNHANIVKVYDIGEAAGALFIVMEYISGPTLQALIGRRRLEIPDAINYTIQIADALSKAHAAGVVHRDVKPANIMVVNGQVKILDFGLAKLVQKDRGYARMTDGETVTLSVTKEGAVLGTVAYMSPEQAEGKPVDGRSDVFSLGSVLYEMVTGRRAFPGGTHISVLSAILRDEPAPVSEAAPRVPRDLEKVISRCLRKDPDRRFQHILDVKLALDDVKQELDAGGLATGPPVPKPRGRYLLMAAATGILAAAIAVGVGSSWLGWRQTPPAAAPLTRLTSDSGISDTPALSPNGNLLVYASDRAGEGNLDLWIKQVPGGEPTRLTRHQSDEYDAAFSPDGTQLVYRSEQDGGGLYIISALGGEPRLLVKRGRSPRFSPDGSEILYGVSSSADSFWGDIYLLPSTGGVPRQVQSQFSMAFTPIWAPDGKHILFLGATTRGAPQDWWVAPVAGGAPVKTGAIDVFKKQDLDVGRPGQWVPGQNRIVFAANSGGAVGIWQIAISPANWRIDSPAQKLTSGTSEDHNYPTLGGGRMAFSSSVWNTDIWAAPLDPNTGKAVGELRRLTQDAAHDIIPYVSADGNKVAFISNRGHIGSDKVNVWLKDVRSGREAALTFTGDILPFFPIITHDGSKVAYSKFIDNRGSIWVVSADGGVPEKLCDDCGMTRSWSPDQRFILCQTGGPRPLSLLDVKTRNSTEFLRHKTAGLYAAQFSPDGRWVAFGARFKPGDERLFIVPVRDGVAPQDEAQWIAVTQGAALDNKPRWSTDGDLLYFTSDRDEFNCVWAQRLDPVTKRPVAAPFPVLHLHGAVRSLAKSGALLLEISVARDKLVFHLDDVRGNIWMTRLPND